MTTWEQREKEGVLYESVLQSAKILMDNVDKIKGGYVDITSYDPESNIEAQFLSKRFPYMNLEQCVHSLVYHEPIDITEYSRFLDCIFRNSTHGHMDMKGLVVFQKDDQVDFCISGSFSSKEFEKMLLHYQERLCHENKK